MNDFQHYRYISNLLFEACNGVCAFVDRLADSLTVTKLSKTGTIGKAKRRYICSVSFLRVQ